MDPRTFELGAKDGHPRRPEEGLLAPAAGLDAQGSRGLGRRGGDGGGILARVARKYEDFHGFCVIRHANPIGLASKSMQIFVSWTFLESDFGQVVLEDSEHRLITAAESHIMGTGQAASYMLEAGGALPLGERAF